MADTVYDWPQQDSAPPRRLAKGSTSSLFDCVDYESNTEWYAALPQPDQDDLTVPRGREDWGPLFHKKHGRWHAEFTSNGAVGARLMPAVSGDPLDRFMLRFSAILDLAPGLADLTQELTQSCLYGFDPHSRSYTGTRVYIQLTTIRLLTPCSPGTGWPDLAYRAVTHADLEPFGIKNHRTLDLGTVPSDTFRHARVMVRDAWRDPSTAMLVSLHTALPSRTDIESMSSHMLTVVHDRLLDTAAWSEAGLRAAARGARRHGVAPVDWLMLSGGVSQREPTLSKDYSGNPQAQQWLRLAAALGSTDSHTTYSMAGRHDRLVPVRHAGGILPVGTTKHLPTLLASIEGDNVLRREARRAAWAGYYTNPVLFGEEVPRAARHLLLLPDLYGTEHDRALEFTRLGLFDVYCEWQGLLSETNDVSEE